MAYYNENELQPVHAADAWNLDRYLFTAVAYLARAGKKKGSTYEDDVLKALWFLAYALIKNTERAEAVVRLCKGWMYEDKTAKGSEIPVHVCSTDDTGDVSLYNIDGRETQSELASETGNTELSGHDDHIAFPERISQWLKGAIE